MWLLYGLLALIVSCQATSEPQQIILRPPQLCQRGDSGVASLGEEWTEGSKLCDCIIPESLLYFWNGENPSAPIKHCRYNGCPVGGGRVLKKGRAFRRGPDICVCMKGSDPGLADASTLYHAICFNKDSGYTFNFDYGSKK